MKRSDFVFILIAIALFLPFFICTALYEWFNMMSRDHGLLMSFFKFAILATMGECIGARIKTGNYCGKGFGLAARSLVWGFLGMFIYIAMKVFATGVPVLLQSLGFENAVASMSGKMSTLKIIDAFSISALMNILFAPIMMTFHKITDVHIEKNLGNLKCLFTGIPIGKIMSEDINWNVQWNFVFKKTIPFFWIPAHTITFLLPEEFRVVFAAMLGVALGVILALASHKK